MRPSRRPARRPRAETAARVVEVDIDSLGARGDGIARLDGEALFVPFTVPGERVVARVEGRRGDGLAAALVEVIRPGPGRVPPPCPHFGRCGGCAVQHLESDGYARWKRDLLLAPLARHGLGATAVAPLLRIAPGSRRRAQFAFQRHRDATLLGFNARASHAVVDLDGCLLLDPAVAALLPALRRILSATIAGGQGGDVTVTRLETGLDVLVEAEARLDLFERERLAAFAEAQDLARLSWRRPGGGGPEPIAHRRPALVRFAGIGVEPPPGSFLQPSIEGEAAIARLVLEGMGPAGPVADLYCGVGSFTLPLAAAGHAVLAVEGEATAVRALQAAANAAGLRVSSETRDLARRPLLAGELRKFRAVLFDPPRAGAQAQAEHLAAAGPPRLVAVSCNPATLARDLEILVRGGYGIDGLTPIDQFPHSAHLEAVAVLSRR